jgi:hypothetical protein
MRGFPSRALASPPHIKSFESAPQYHTLTFNPYQYYYSHGKIGNDSRGGEKKMTNDPNLRGNMIDNEWNSEDVQNEIMFSGIIDDEWLENRRTDDEDYDYQDDDHNDYVW